MIDEMFDRGYQDARGNLNAGLADAFADAFGGVTQTIGDSLKVLHRMEWNAPWAPRKRRARRA